MPLIEKHPLTSTYVKEKLRELKAVIKPHTLVVGDFNTPLSQMDRSIRQKPNREIRELIEVINQMDLTDTYRTFHPNRKEYTFFSAAHGTFSKIDHILGNKANFHRYKKYISNHLCLVRPPWIKDRIQEQCYPQEAKKFMEVEQSTTESPLGQGRNKERN